MHTQISAFDAHSINMTVLTKRLDVHDSSRYLSVIAFGQIQLQCVCSVQFRAQPDPAHKILWVMPTQPRARTGVVTSDCFRLSSVVYTQPRARTGVLEQWCDWRVLLWEDLSLKCDSNNSIRFRTASAPATFSGNESLRCKIPCQLRTSSEQTLLLRFAQWLFGDASFLWRYLGPSR